MLFATFFKFYDGTFPSSSNDASTKRAKSHIQTAHFSNDHYRRVRGVCRTVVSTLTLALHGRVGATEHQ
jgi:hypothetical protein